MYVFSTESVGRTAGEKGRVGADRAGLYKYKHILEQTDIDRCMATIAYCVFVVCIIKFHWQ